MVVPNYPPEVLGGGEISCKLLVDALRKKKIDVDLIVGSRLFPHASVIKMVRGVNKYLKRRKDEYDIIHTYNMTFLPIIGGLTKKYNCNTVATLNGIKFSNEMIDPAKNNLIRKIRNSFFIKNYIKHISRFTTLCPVYKKLWINDGIDAEKISVIPNMIDPDFPVYNKNHDGFRVLFVGNKAWWRDIDPVIELSKNNEYRVTIVGKGWNVPSHIGQRSASYNQMPDVYANSDVLIASYKLPLPISRCIIEAMQFGIPVVATGSNEVSPVISDGIDGVLTQNKNIANIVEKLFQDKKWYDSISIQAKERVTTYCSPSNLVERYLDVYENVLC